MSDLVQDKPLLLFKHRLKIEQLFLAYCRKNYVDKNHPISFVAFLQSKGWLNVEKILEDLQNEH